jgi:hypothetical protein
MPFFSFKTVSSNFSSNLEEYLSMPSSFTSRFASAGAFLLKMGPSQGSAK